MHSFGQRLLVGASGTALVFFAARASGEPQRGYGKNPCLSAYKNALELEQSAHLRQARELLLVCARPSCGNFLQQECTAKYLHLDDDIPSVVLLATDDTGTPRVDIRVTMDGELLAAKLDGVSLPVDPGVHEFSFSSDGSVFATQRILAVQGQRNRPITVSLPTVDRFGLAPSVTQPGAIEAKTSALGMKATLRRRETDEKAVSIDKPATSDKPKEAAIDREPPATQPEVSVPAAGAIEAPSPEERSKKTHGRPAAAYWLGGAGLVGLGAYGMLVYWARTDNMSLAGCSPNCSRESVDHIRHLYLAADVSFGVGVAAVGTAAWLLLTSTPKNEVPAHSAYGIDVRPTRSGAFAAVSGTF
jgi:hypothetical protein